MLFQINHKFGDVCVYNLSSGNMNTDTHRQTHNAFQTSAAVCGLIVCHSTLLYAAFQSQILFISSIHSFSIFLFHSHSFLFPSIQKTQRYCNFTEIWLTLAAFREARANVLWRILNLDVWSSTDCEGENSSPHLIRHRDPDPNTELIEPVNASAPYHHATKGFLDTHTLFTFRYQDHVRAEKHLHFQKYQNRMTFFTALKYSDRIYTINGNCE